MSDTPRTDSEAFLPHDSKEKVCDSDFARILERELNAANDEIEEKRKDVVWLATEKAKLEERIKRLEIIISRARNRFFCDGSNGRAASGMLAILEEERNKR